MSSLPSLHEALNALRTAWEEENWEEAAALAACIRPHWHLLAQDKQAREGWGQSRALIKTLFCLGVFDDPPLSGPPYEAWRFLQDAPSTSLPQGEKPLVSILMPVFDPDPHHFTQALASIGAQSWQQWELCLVDDASTQPQTRAIMSTLAQRDGRVKILFRPTNGHISVASNSALTLATGEWCLPMDQDDLLAPWALARLVQAACQAPAQVGVLFGDEDHLEAGGENPVHSSPLLKPGFDPELILSCNYINHPALYRTHVLRKIGGYRQGLEGSQDYDLILRILAQEGAKAFQHVPGVLYHWRQHAGSTAAGVGAKPYARKAAMTARRDFAHAVSREQPQTMSFSPYGTSGFATIRFHPPRPLPQVSLILLADEEETRRGYSGPWITAWQEAGHELLFAPLVSDSGQALPAAGSTLNWEEKAHGWGARLAFSHPLLWPQAILQSAKLAQGEVLAFFRLGDIPGERYWLQNMLGVLLRPGVGIVGCRSLSPQGFLRQAGYAVGRGSLSLAHRHYGRYGLKGNAAPLWMCPAYAGLHKDASGYFSQAHLLHSVPAVMYPGMFIRRSHWDEAGGLNPEAGDLADADLCLRLWHNHQFRSVISPQGDVTSRRIPMPLAANAWFLERWQAILEEKTPFQHPFLDWTAGGWRLLPG